MQTTFLPPEPKLLPLGDEAWTVEFGEVIDPQVHARVLGFAAALERERSSGRTVYDFIVDVVPTFRSLTVYYHPPLDHPEPLGEQLGQALLELAARASSVSAVGRQWLIPVCFDADLAPDLAEVAATKGLTPDDVIALMTGANFQVYMVGFMPGFPYMGGLPGVLEMPRLASPRTAVPARSLGITGAMCAVYPWESPGGWRLIGRTPVPFFSMRESGSPSLLVSGDRVRWRAIGRSEFDALEEAGRAGVLERRQFLLAEGGA